jgi:hypothetical protein
LLDNRAECDSREERQAADDQDHTDDKTHKHRGGGAERSERDRHDVLRGERTSECQRRNENSASSDQHVDRTEDVVERRIAGETGHRRAVVVALRRECVEDLGEAVRARI